MRHIFPCLLFFCCVLRAFSLPHYNGEIIPAPQRILTPWKFLPLATDNVTITVDATKARSLVLAKKLLLRRLHETLQSDYRHDQTLPLDIIIGTKDSSALKSAQCATLKPEGYALRLQQLKSRNIIRIIGNDNRGAFYGAMTLLQLIGRENNRPVLKIADMDDFPIWKERYLSDYIPMTGEWLTSLAIYKVNGYGFQPRNHWKAFGIRQKPRWSHFDTWEQGLADMKRFADETGLMDFMFVHNIYAADSPRTFDISRPDHLKKLLNDCDFIASMGIRHIQIGVDDFVPVNGKDYEFVSETEKTTFGRVGRSHGFLMTYLHSNLRDRYPALKLSFCPAPYTIYSHDAQHNPGRQYLADFHQTAPESTWLVWCGPHVVSSKITQHDLNTYRRLISNHKTYLWHNPTDVNGWMGTLPKLDIEPHYIRDSQGIFFANSHSALFDKKPLTVCYADYLWKPDGYGQRDTFGSSFQQATGIRNLVPMKRVMDKLKRLQGTYLDREKIAIISDLQKDLESLQNQGYPIQKIESFVNKELALAKRIKPQCTVPQLTVGAPIIDGRLNEEAWSKARILSIPGKHPTTVSLLHDHGHTLYLAIKTTLTSALPPAQPKPRNSKVEQSALAFAFFLAPLLRTPRYAKFAFDYTGNMANAIRWSSPWHPDWKIKTLCQGKDCIAEIAVPIASMVPRLFWRKSINKGDIWKAQFCRYSQDGRMTQRWAGSSPTPIDEVKSFGELIFE